MNGKKANLIRINRRIFSSMKNYIKNQSIGQSIKLESLTTQKYNPGTSYVTNQITIPRIEKK